MGFRAIGGALLLSSLLNAGCGTIANVVKPGPAGGKIPFGGVNHDLEYVKAANNEEGDCKTDSGPDLLQHPQGTQALMCAADVPFSFIGDVITWPYTAAYTFINSPVPTPPMIFAPNDPPPQMNFAEYKEPELKAPAKDGDKGKTPDKDADKGKTPEKDGDKGKSGDGLPTQLPPPRPLPLPPLSLPPS